LASYDLELDQRLSEETTVLVESYTVGHLFFLSDGPHRNVFQLPDGRTIKVGPERFEAPECMFQPHLVDLDQPGVAGAPLFHTRVCVVNAHLITHAIRRETLPDYPKRRS
jgi:hypothetical protein